MSRKKSQYLAGKKNSKRSVIIFLNARKALKTGVRAIRPFFIRFPRVNQRVFLLLL